MRHGTGCVLSAFGNVRTGQSEAYMRLDRPSRCLRVLRFALCRAPLCSAHSHRSALRLAPATKQRRRASSTCVARNRLQPGIQRAHPWGIAGGTQLERRRDSLRVQELVSDFESGPGSHPRTSEDFQGGPPRSSALARTSRIQTQVRLPPTSRDFRRQPNLGGGISGGIGDSFRTDTPTQSSKNCEQMREMRQRLESDFGIRTHDGSRLLHFWIACDPQTCRRFGSS
jgi:hypothetical protein